MIANAHEYGCSSYTNGRACENVIRVKREGIEQIILGPIRHELLAPERVG